MALSKQHKTVGRGLSKKATEYLHLPSFNQARLPVKQIVGTFDEIRQYVIQCQNRMNIYPRSLLAEDFMISAKENFQNQATNLECYGLAYMTDNLCVSGNFVANIKPDECLFDVCLIVDDSPITVVTVVCDGNADMMPAKRYNRSLARGMIDALRDFTSEQFTVLYGLMTESDLSDKKRFTSALKEIRTESSRLCVPDSLTMSVSKYTNLLNACLLSIAVTQSFSNPQARKDSLWLLTVEQFVILTENIDKSVVIVRTAPFSGGKVLMHEVARRLGRSGPTLMVVQSDDLTQVSGVKQMTLQDWKTDPQQNGIRNIVTNCPECPIPRNLIVKAWTFISGSDFKDRHTDERCKTENRAHFLKTSTDPPPETLHEVRKALERKTIEMARLKNENQRLKQRLGEFTRKMETVSVGGMSMDSGLGSETSSLASFGTVISSGSKPSKDKKILAGQKGPGMLLKRVQRTLSFSKPKTDHLVPSCVTAGGPVYVLTDLENKNPVSILCHNHEMDKQGGTSDNCRITEEGKFVNYGGQNSTAYEMFLSTSGTSAISLSPSVLTSAPQYWETETEIEAKKAPELWWLWPVLELGIVEEGNLKDVVLSCGEDRSWCIRVVYCNTHQTFCTQIWNQRKRVICVKDSLCVTQGKSQTLTYGVVVDVARGRLGFIDVSKGNVLVKMDIQLQESVYPVFGVYAFPECAKVETKVVSGWDIMMTESKQKLIYFCVT